MRFPRKRGVAAVALTCALSLAACSGGSSGNVGGFDPGTTSGPAWAMPAAALLSPFSADAVSAAAPVVDLSHASEGYVAASATSDARLKLQVVCGEMSYNYDLPSDGSRAGHGLQCWQSSSPCWSDSAATCWVCIGLQTAS